MIFVFYNPINSLIYILELEIGREYLTSLAVSVLMLTIEIKHRQIRPVMNSIFLHKQYICLIADDEVFLIIKDKNVAEVVKEMLKKK